MPWEVSSLDVWGAPADEGGWSINNWFRQRPLAAEIGPAATDAELLQALKDEGHINDSAVLVDPYHETEILASQNAVYFDSAGDGPSLLMEARGGPPSQFTVQCLPRSSAQWHDHETYDSEEEADAEVAAIERWRVEPGGMTVKIDDEMVRISDTRVVPSAPQDWPVLQIDFQHHPWIEKAADLLRSQVDPQANADDLHKAVLFAFEDEDAREQLLNPDSGSLSKNEKDSMTVDMHFHQVMRAYEGWLRYGRG